MALNLTTIESGIYGVFYDLLQTGTYALTTDNIHPYVSDVTWTTNQKTFPIVEVRIDIEKLPRARLGSPAKTASGQAVITAFHNSSVNIKALADEIRGKFATEGALQVLSGNGIKVRDVNSDNQEPQGYAPKRTMHSEVITVEFDWNAV